METEIIGLICDFSEQTYIKSYICKEDFKGKTLPEIRFKLEHIYQKWHNCNISSCTASCGTCNKYKILCKYIDNYINNVYNFDDNKYFELTKKYNNLNTEYKELKDKYDKIKKLME